MSHIYPRTLNKVRAPGDSSATGPIAASVLSALGVVKIDSLEVVYFEVSYPCFAVLPVYASYLALLQRTQNSVIIPALLGL